MRTPLPLVELADVVEVARVDAELLGALDLPLHEALAAACGARGLLRRTGTRGARKRKRAFTPTRRTAPLDLRISAFLSSIFS